MAQNSHRKRDKLNAQDRKQVVDISVRAQDFMMKQASIRKDNHNTTHDDLFQSTFQGATTNASIDLYDNTKDISSIMSNHNKSVTGEPDETAQNFSMLPSIKLGAQKSPFKGFLDISIVSQKLKKGMGSQDRARNAFNASLDMSPLNNTGPVRAISRDRGGPPLTTTNAERQAGNRFQKKDTQVQMSPKVLETWINETLTDAEHLDIPGVILKPEHKNPISRYGIDRISFSAEGIPTETVDRVYRALFVYSVGFYELVKRCLEHTNKKYTIITNIWKVFAILLEYCCRTDYRMLIAEISKENKAELDKLDADYQNKFQEQAANEKVLKENQEMLVKVNEELERERINERQMRLKLEEEYLQNTKNHEEEVQLRLKFESKLNNMHSAHRDLESKYKRVLIDLNNSERKCKNIEQAMNERNAEVVEIRTAKAELDSTLLVTSEELQSVRRELTIKNKQLKDAEARSAKLNEDLDQQRYMHQESLKDGTELKLKIDVLNSTIEGLNSEKKHQELELRETRELLKIFEEKSTTLTTDLQTTTAELNENKRMMITFNQTNSEKDEKIATLRKDLMEFKAKSEDLELRLGTLQINHEKLQATSDQHKKDYDATVDKLHQMNKARHDLETLLTNEIEKTRSLQDIVRLKEDTIAKKQVEIEELDKRIIELERALEALEIKKQGVEKMFEMTKKQMNDKAQQLTEQIQSEKETRDLWVDRYEKEQKEHTKTNSALLESKASLKDKELAVKNCEIQLNTAQRQNQLLQEQSLKNQHIANENMTKVDNLDRELNTQKAIMVQMEQTKKEYIDRLKRELDGIETRYLQIVNENCMTGEEYRSQAYENLQIILELRRVITTLEETIHHRNQTIKARETTIRDLKQEVNQEMMRYEDAVACYTLETQVSEKWHNCFLTSEAQLSAANDALAKLKEEKDSLLKVQNVVRLDKDPQTDLNLEMLAELERKAAEVVQLQNQNAQLEKKIEDDKNQIQQMTVQVQQQAEALKNDDRNKSRGSRNSRKDNRSGNGTQFDANGNPIGPDLDNAEDQMARGLGSRKSSPYPMGHVEVKQTFSRKTSKGSNSPVANRSHEGGIEKIPSNRSVDQSPKKAFGTEKGSMQSANKSPFQQKASVQNSQHSSGIMNQSNSRKQSVENVQLSQGSGAQKTPQPVLQQLSQTKNESLHKSNGHVSPANQTESQQFSQQPSQRNSIPVNQAEAPQTMQQLPPVANNFPPMQGGTPTEDNNSAPMEFQNQIQAAPIQVNEDQARKEEIARLQQNRQRQPKGNSHIRKLITSAATRDD